MFRKSPPPREYGPFYRKSKHRQYYPRSIILGSIGCGDEHKNTQLRKGGISSGRGQPWIPFSVTVGMSTSILGSPELDYILISDIEVEGGFLSYHICDLEDFHSPPKPHSPPNFS
jgi:hypothetical protein